MLQRLKTRPIVHEDLTSPQAQEAIGDYDLAQAYNNIVAFDGWVGEKLADLEKSGEFENTVIFVFSDHG